MKFVSNKKLLAILMCVVLLWLYVFFNKSLYGSTGFGFGGRNRRRDFHET